MIRRLDHVALIVVDTEAALLFYRDYLKLRVASSEEIPVPHVRLTYLDLGNAYLQLVEPLDDDSPMAVSLAESGEGFHHICFGVDDVPEAVATMSDDGAQIVLGSGRGRVSSFVVTSKSHGARLECTEFVHSEDVVATAGWLDHRSS